MHNIFTGESGKLNREITINVNLLGPYKGHVKPYLGHVWAILGTSFGYFYKIFASRCLKWLKFSLESIQAK